ncbi:MAG TPA: hypothetical protein VGJ05_02955 [Fimbriiglobus sp.]|jgi:hypothetical protein
MEKTSEPSFVPLVQAGEFVPPDNSIWQKYNERLEMPISFSTSALVFTACVFLLALTLGFLNTDNRKPVPITLWNGDDLFGAGSAGSGGVPDDLAKGFSPPTPEMLEKFKPQVPIDEIKKQMNDTIKVDAPNASITVPDDQAVVYSSLDKELRDKLLGVRKGQGAQQGKGFDGNGTGPGGTGADNTLARSMRWVMKFNVRDGRDYVSQLALLRATLLVPIPPDNKQMMIFDNLSNPTPGRIASDSDIDRLSRQMRFSDVSDEAVKQVTRALGINSFTPQAFFAFFPKDLEDDLAKKERDYRRKRTEDIEETKFKVTVTGNSFRIDVVDQKMKR